MIENSRSWIVFSLLMPMVMEQVRLWARLKQPRKKFFRETVTPIFAGWFSEVNKDYNNSYLNACTGGCSRRRRYADVPFGQFG
jgi:hypothetical protein